MNKEDVFEDEKVIKEEVFEDEKVIKEVVFVFVLPICISVNGF